MRLLFSGGHLTPALAVIDYIQASHPEIEIVFVGRLHARQSDKQPSPEKQEISKRKIKFVPFNSGKFGEGSLPQKIYQLFLTVVSTFRAFFIVARYQPSAFISFGGYLAVPLAVASWLWRVPILTHEQTRAIGVANRFIANLANKVAISFAQTGEGLPKSKVVITGNPVRPSVMSDGVQPSWFFSQSSKPILYVTGGSQGSEILNTTIARAADALLKDWIVIHQCGFASKTRNYQHELGLARQRVSKQKQDRYYIRPWIEESELAWIYNNAEAVVTRAGANTLQEIVQKQVPSIIVPLPFSNNDEQLLNAKALSEQEAAILLQQKDLDPNSLQVALAQLQKKSSRFRRNLKNLADQNELAAKNIYDLILKIVKKSDSQKR